MDESWKPVPVCALVSQIRDGSGKHFFTILPGRQSSSPQGAQRRLGNTENRLIDRRYPLFTRFPRTGEVLHHREHRGHWETQRTPSLTADIRAVTGGDARRSTDAGVGAE